MSFLLDALRKSEQQRRLGQTPSIQIPSIATSQPPARRIRKLWLALGLVVMVLLAWLLFLQSSSEQPAEPAVAAVEQINSAVQPLAETAPAAAANAAGRDSRATDPVHDQRPIPESSQSAGLPSALTPRNSEQAVSDFNALAEQIAARQASAIAAQQQTAATPAADNTQAGSSQPAQPELSVAAAVQGTGSGSSPQQPGATADQADAQEQAQEQVWQPDRPAYISYFELPVDIRQALPELPISIRVYDKSPEKRFVIIGRKRLFEGDTVPENDAVKVVEIKRSSLILEFQGYVFEYQ